ANAGKASPWSDIWAWADSIGGPLPRYHACQVFVENSSYVPEGENGALWREILETMVVPDKKADWLRWNLPWRLRCELLRHFTAHFECNAPGEDGERIAAAALWVTERVARACSLPVVDIARLLDQTIEPTEDQSRGVWKIARPPTRSCSLRYAA